jgi:hypothetical protein
MTWHLATVLFFARFVLRNRAEQVRATFRTSEVP